MINVVFKFYSNFYFGVFEHHIYDLKWECYCEGSWILRHTNGSGILSTTCPVLPKYLYGDRGIGGEKEPSVSIYKCIFSDAFSVMFHCIFHEQERLKLSLSPFLILSSVNLTHAYVSWLGETWSNKMGKFGLRHRNLINGCAGSKWHT